MISNRKNKRTTVLFMLMLQILLAVPSASFANLTLSLQEAVLLSLRSNPNVRNAQMQRVIDKYSIRLGQFDFEMQYSLDATATSSHVRSQGVGTANNSYSLTPGATYKLPFGTTLSADMKNSSDQNGYKPTVDFSIKQPLLRGFGKAVTMRGLQDVYDTEILNQITLKNVVIDQINLVINSYWSVVEAENSLKTQEDALKNSEAFVRQNDALIKAGKLAPNENLPARSAAASQRLSVTQAKFSLLNAKQELLKTIGFLDPNENIIISSKPNIENRKLPTFKKSYDLALRRNLDYHKAILQIRFDERSLIVARDNLRWQLDASVDTTRGPGTGIQGLHDHQNNSTIYGLTLKVPINNISARKDYVQAKIRLEQDRLALQQAKRDLAISVRQQINTLTSQYQQVQQAQVAIQLAQQSLSMEQKKLEHGMSTSINVNAERTRFLNAQISYISNEINFLKSMAAFGKITGETLDDWGIKLRY